MILPYGQSMVEFGHNVRLTAGTEFNGALQASCVCGYVSRWGTKKDTVSAAVQHRKAALDKLADSVLQYQFLNAPELPDWPEP